LEPVSPPNRRSRDRDRTSPRKAKPRKVPYRPEVTGLDHVPDISLQEVYAIEGSLQEELERLLAGKED
jgi:hypothetical protein